MLKLDLAGKAAAHADHWTNAEAALGRAIILPDGTTQKAFVAQGNVVSTAQSTVISRTNDLEGAQRSRDALLETLQRKAALLTALVRGATPGSVFANMLPKLPTTSAAAIKWVKALEDLAGIWERLDAAPAGQYPALAHPPLLSDGTTQAAFVAELTALQGALRGVQEATNDIKEARGALAEAGKTTRAALAAYRTLIRGLFRKTDPILTSLPPG